MPPLFTPVEISDSELREIISDMREEATRNRDAARRNHSPHYRDMLTAEAIVIEHWVNRLGSLLTLR